MTSMISQERDLRCHGISALSERWEVEGEGIYLLNDIKKNIYIYIIYCSFSAKGEAEEDWWNIAAWHPVIGQERRARRRREGRRAQVRQTVMKTSKDTVILRY